MRNLFTEEWLKTLKQLGSELPSMDLTVTCQYEISGAPQGKVRYYIDIQKGKITDAELGKHPSPNCSISTTYKEVSSILQQEKSVEASFMQGNFKIDGEYEKYLLTMNAIRSTKEWQNMQQALTTL
ncbi:MAG: SCP2 sterol-binding domain-containing protein [Actinomycetota bacterium]|jgi:hypothetical protein|nr:hypothetical protein [Actinomycetota bacterium]MCH2616534.1 SCP2 sterol-binding domain-containing protein [Acidimicrobiales bacterium]MED5230432.1 SCP2 sterol-binding domain-containing protein [Actinomycetota bacterium]MED5445421.1 SCP2 sterol-binding domain-containing protein [Actinomycetota bacterium]|tara:strand:+ start:2140 stop:2517 length:378 start_codon:yes stop_codon:yes gene_type:complete